MTSFVDELLKIGMPRRLAPILTRLRPPSNSIGVLIRRLMAKRADLVPGAGPTERPRDPKDVATWNPGARRPGRLAPGGGLGGVTAPSDPIDASPRRPGTR